MRMSKESGDDTFLGMDRMRWESNLLFSRVNGKIETLDRVYTISEGSECMER